MSHTETLYLEKIGQLQQQKQQAQRTARIVLWLRLCTFAASVTLLFALWSTSPALATALCLAMLGLFGAVAAKDIRLQRSIRRYDTLIAICRSEIASISGSIAGFDDGAEFLSLKHPYAYDLDIVGPGSLFQLVCRTRTRHGKEQLAGRLLAPLPYSAIRPNQEAVAELADLLEWRLDLTAASGDNADAQRLDTLYRWAAAPALLPSGSWLRWLTVVAPVVTVTLAALSVAGVVSSALPTLMLVVYGFVYAKYGKAITVTHSAVGQMAAELESLSHTLSIIERNRYKAPLLAELTKGLDSNGRRPSAIVREFAAAVQQLDSRANVAFMLLAGIYLLWDVKAALKLERWRCRHGAAVGRWVEIVGEMEALSSLATLAFNHPDWCMPTVEQGYFRLSARDAGHPIIPPDRRVCNTFEIGNGELILLTGSNMAGKSTFLRTLGVNMVLAYAGAPVCAVAFSTDYTPVRTSMRITDSLTENTSSFYAEIKRLGEIVAAVKGGERPFILLDEILRGTNSNDRHIGSLALIDMVVENGVCGIIATHDLALTDVQERYPEKTKNYHFDVQVDENDELYFDYKVKSGVCTSLNASILMRKIGLPVKETGR